MIEQHNHNTTQPTCTKQDRLFVVCCLSPRSCTDFVLDADGVASIEALDRNKPLILDVRTVFEVDRLHHLK